MKRLFLFIFSLSFVAISGQSVDNLQAELDKAAAELESINNSLSQNRNQQNKSEERIQLLQKKLNIRQKIVNQTNQKIASLEKKLKSYDSKVFLCSNIIDSLTVSYTSILRMLQYKSYCDDLYDPLFSFRLNFLKPRLQFIIQTQDSTIQKTGIAINQVTNQKKELQILLNKRKSEISSIVRESKQLDSLRRSLKLGESKLLSQIEKQRARINQLQHEIERIIALDNSSTVKTHDEITDSFRRSVGTLPSPLSVKSRVIDSYGVHDHSSIKGVKVSNNGINLAFKGPSDISSIFQGEVRGIYSIAGLASTVLVRHGTYISVYSNLTSVFVSKGDKVTQGQKLGSISSSTDEELFFHFELWKEQNTLDPTLWIRFN